MFSVNILNDCYHAEINNCMSFALSHIPIIIIDYLPN